MQLILVGGNRSREDGPLLRFAEIARERSVSVTIISEPHHLAQAGPDGIPLRDRLIHGGHAFKEWSSFDPQALAQISGPETIVLLVNSIWILTKEHLDLVPLSFNYHNARLPEERGAAAYSWKILSGVREGGLTIHKVAVGLDRGDIVLEDRFSFGLHVRTCMDHYREIREKEDGIFHRFLDILAQGPDFECEVQNEAQSLYWPRLSTDLHGFIDWSWQAAEIVSFANAFDSPHPGASTFLNDERIRLTGCSLVEDSISFHPFQAGLVVRTEADCQVVAARGGAIRVARFLDEAGRPRNKSIPLGMRFFTPRDVLERALVTRVGFKSDGMVVLNSASRNVTQ